MIDLISRQAAIDALRDKFKRTPTNAIRAMDAVKQLSPVPTETHEKRTETHSCDLIKRQDAIDYFVINVGFCDEDGYQIDDSDELRKIWTDYFDGIPPAQSEDYTELKREFLRMASYIDALLECSDEQKETLIGFISRLAEFMPWTERD